MKDILNKIYGILTKRQKLIFIIIVLIMIISAGLTQVTPKAIGWLTDDILNVNDVTFSKVIPFLLIILIATVANEIIKITRRVMVEDIATKTGKNARGMVIKSLLKAPLSYFKENMVGNIHGRLNRCLEGTIKLEKLLFMDFAPAIFNSIAAVITIFLTLPVTLALAMLLVVPVGVIIVLKQINSQKGIRVELLESKSAMDGTIVELINGIEVIRVCDSVDFETNRLDSKSEFLRKKEMKHHKAMALYDCLKFINQAVFTVLIIGISTYLATKNIISVGSVLTAYLCFNQLIKPLEELHRIFDELSECAILSKDFFKMVEIPSDFSYDEMKKLGEVIKEDSIINIKDLTFYYNEDKEKIILNKFNLSVEKGMFLGVVGPSGCGKSSLIKIISKLEKGYGDIVIDNRKIESLNRKDIANLVALVPQNPFLISGTIKENICYGIDREVSDEELINAARKAYIYEYIKELPEGFQSMVSEGGSNLSGGQRQRIAIARIFLRKPKILILDEATSALDNTSEKHVQMEIENMQKEICATVISIAHRLSTLKNCDEIIVLNKGCIEQRGKYEELIKEDGMFNAMYYGKLN